MNRKKVLAISGSTRKNSANHSLIKAITDLYKNNLDISIFESIEDLPQFNPDKDDEHVASIVSDFRRQLDDADGVIICTPEYAHGVPGALKNAIDWTVSSSQFPGKPTLLITASTGGNYGHQALMQTLKAIDAKNIGTLQMVIPFIKTKINMDNSITDNKTLADVKLIIEKLIETINENTVD